MTTVPTPFAGWSSEVDDRRLTASVRRFVEALPAPPHLLALGEPTHGEPAFRHLRNRIFELLVDHGFRSIAIESDRVAALQVDTFVRGEGGTLDSALGEGFSHGFGQLDANRDLVAWMRAYNESRPAADRLVFYGFDAPLEMSSAPSPRRYLQHVHGYLAEYLGEHRGADSSPHGREDLEQLLGDEQRWSAPAAVMDAARSIGGSPEATALRVIADDLLTALYAHAPRLIAASTVTGWRCAEVHAKAALGLLRYHAQAAQPAPQAERTSRLLGVRDALMAQNLLDIRTVEQHRGATLVFGHNRHIQRHPSTWRLADMDLEWFSAGSIVASLLGNRYTVIVGSLGTSAALGLPTPDADTFEGALAKATQGCALFDAAQLGAVMTSESLRIRPDAGGPHPRTDISAEQGYFPLDTATLRHCDAVLHIASCPEGHREGHPDQNAGPTPADLAERILALPDVTHMLADEGSGAPQVSWGDRFFFVGSDRLRPFATIVEHDVPGFDEDSRLDRAGIFRLNIGIGREEFQRQFGYPPAELPDHRPGIDFARSDEILPHPAYGRQGWACILNPTPRRLQDIDRLLAHAHRRALNQHQRTLDRHHTSR
jgi:erythromycin esterase-like protein